MPATGEETYLCTVLDGVDLWAGVLYSDHAHAAILSGIWKMLEIGDILLDLLPSICSHREGEE